MHFSQFTGVHTSMTVWFPDPTVERWSECEGEKCLVNNSTLAQIHGCIPAISVDERKNAMSANQSLNSTNLQEALCHDVIVLGCDWCNLEQWLTDCNEA